jgi:hypothetical protein
METHRSLGCCTQPEEERFAKYICRRGKGEYGIPKEHIAEALDVGKIALVGTEQHVKIASLVPIRRTGSWLCSTPRQPGAAGQRPSNVLHYPCVNTDVLFVRPKFRLAVVWSETFRPPLYASLACRKETPQR